MALQIAEPDGATPLSQEDIEGLRVALRTRAELNEVEAINIAKAMHWLRRARPGDVLTEAFVYRLHSKMFDEVWKWAGAQRVRETTLPRKARHKKIRVSAIACCSSRRNSTTSSTSTTTSGHTKPSG